MAGGGATRERSIAGRTAIVTGAASGMGRATAELFAEVGARVAVWDLDPAAVDEVVTGIRREGGDASGCAADLADADAIDEAVAQIRADLGPIDIIVNNAGIARPVPLDDDAFLDSWFATLDVDLTAHVHLIRACLGDLARNGEGRVVNISSTEGLGGMADNAAYAAAKHGVIGITRALAVELGRRGVTVNAVCPGPINTGMTEAIPDDAKATFARRRTALRRYGEPREVAQMTLSLVLPAAAYTTGVALPVDGGMTARSQ